VVVNAFYRHSRMKCYPKDGRALRIEAVINDTYDIGVLRRLEHLDELVAKPVTPTVACWRLSVSVRVASL
jgi:hypothetical protein